MSIFFWSATILAPVGAQDLQQGRAPLLDGITQSIGHEISSSDTPDSNDTWAATIAGLPTAQAIKLKLRHVAGADADVVVRRGSQEIVRYSLQHLAETGPVWTPLLLGSTVRIELVRRLPSSTEIRVAVDAVASHVPPTKPTLNIVRHFDLEDIDYIRLNQPEIFAASRPVAKIAFVSSKGPAVCTGFMVSADRMLTNHHCISKDEVCASADLIFGFDSSRDIVGKEMQRCIRVVDKDELLDASLIQVAGSPGDRWGFLDLGVGEATLNEPAVVVQHPAGFHKFVSRKDCVVSTMPANGLATSSDFGHSCDTMEGSSGSPVLRRADLKVIGLHHWGFIEGDQKWGSENRAVRIGLIADRFGLR
jgi:hypothetical protein